MAPTISEIADCRDHISLEDHLQLRLKITEFKKTNDILKTCKRTRRYRDLNTLRGTLCHRMGLVVDQVVREGDAPSFSPRSRNGHPTQTECSQYSKKQDLIDITLRTMALLKQNQQLQKQLTALQMETRAYVKEKQKHNETAS